MHNDLSQRWLAYDWKIFSYLISIKEKVVYNIETNKLFILITESLLLFYLSYCVTMRQLLEKCFPENFFCIV